MTTHVQPITFTAKVIGASFVEAGGARVPCVQLLSPLGGTFLIRTGADTGRVIDNVTEYVITATPKEPK